MRLAWVVVVVLACRSSSDSAPPAPQASLEQEPSGEGDRIVQPGGAASGRLSFAITKVHERRRPSMTPPFHEPGGDWRYVEAHVAGDHAAKFVVGMPALSETGEVSFASMYLVPMSGEAGRRVIAHLAGALSIPEPPPVAGGTLAPMKIDVGVLGHGIGKSADGFSGRGTWDATKWFCSTDEGEPAELFFNIDVVNRRGEWSEKDSEYNADVTACLAAVLRDGRPAPRSSASDPTLGAGLRIEIGKQIGSAGMTEIGLSAKRLILSEELGDHAVLLSVDPRTGVRQELASTPDRYEGGQCDETATRCVVRVSKPTGDRNAFVFQGPATLVLLDGATVTPLSVPAFGERPTVPRWAVSPDGRIVVVEAHAAGDRRLVAWNRVTGRTVELVARRGDTLDLVDWVKDGPRWIAIVVKNRERDGEPGVMLEWRVDAGGKTVPSKLPAPYDYPPVSPSATRRADFTSDGRLVIQPLPSGPARTLTFHPQDARHTAPGCCPWLDDRYIELRAGRLGLIDTDTMKVSFAPPREESDDGRVALVRGTRTAVVFRDDGVFLATLMGP